jgi:hypothetical protein
MTASSQLLNDLKDILPAIAANAEKAEALRMMPQENIELLTKIKFLRAFQPKAWGGKLWPVYPALVQAPLGLPAYSTPTAINWHCSLSKLKKTYGAKTQKPPLAPALRPLVKPPK